MLKVVEIKIEEIYVPVERRKEIDPQAVEAAAEKVLDDSEDRPIQVRVGKGRYVLVKGINRLEAHKSLGEDTIGAYIVAAKRH